MGFGVLLDYEQGNIHGGIHVSRSVKTPVLEVRYLVECLHFEVCLGYSKDYLDCGEHTYFWKLLGTE